MKKYCKIIMIIGISIFILFFLMTQKEGMHLDEFYSYGLSNDDIEDGSIFFEPEQGVKYNAKEVMDEYLFTDSFNIRNVWMNQSEDVHPPLYYLVFHVFGLITNYFLGIKTGVILNILIHIVNIVLIYLILGKLCCDKTLSIMGTFLYAVTPIVLGNVLFVRMYTMLAMWVLCLLFISVSYWDEERNNSYALLALVTIAGTLTHYYFLIFLFYVCLVTGGYLLVKRRWKDIFYLLLTMGVSGAICIGVFPAMLNHIFVGYRGEESFANLRNSSIIDRINYFGSLIDDQVYGGLFVAYVTFVIVVILLDRNIIGFTKTEGTAKKGQSVWLIVLLPASLYLVTISKIAIHTTSRYISCLYGVCVIILMGLFKYITEKTFKSDKIKILFCACMIGVMLNNSWNSYTWPELWSEAEACMQNARYLGQNSECIYVYDRAYHGLPSYGEFIQYRQISFVAADNIQILNDDIYTNYDQVVVYFFKDLEEDLINECINQLIANNPNLEYGVEIHEYSYNVAYLLK